jgi:two-component system sensor histidine kinase/response regulator
MILIFFLIVINKNFRDKKKANIELQAAKEKAEQSEKFKQQFLANMSHEIRTPMNAVMGMTNLLLDKNPRPDQMNYLSGINKSSGTLLHIINDILDLSKIEAGKIELEQIDFSISKGVEQVKQTLHHKAEEKGI